MSNNFEAQIEFILDEFDFERVHRVMELLDWKWATDVPSIGDLRRTARELLQDIALHPEWVVYGTGGLRAENIEGKFLRLAFVLADMDSSDMEEMLG